jgi:hypothetical protein
MLCLTHKNPDRPPTPFEQDPLRVCFEKHTPCIGVDSAASSVKSPYRNRNRRTRLQNPCTAARIGVHAARNRRIGVEIAVHELQIGVPRRESAYTDPEIAVSGSKSLYTASKSVDRGPNRRTRGPKSLHQRRIGVFGVEISASGSESAAFGPTSVRPNVKSARRLLICWLSRRNAETWAGVSAQRSF